MDTPADQLEAARLALAKSEAKGLTLGNSLSDSQWTSRHARGGWSPAECFVHLNLTTSAMLPLLQAGTEEARTHQWTSEDPFSVGFLAKALCWFLEPPYRIRIATQPAFMPRAPAEMAEVLTDWKDRHRSLDTLIRDSAGLALDRPVIVSPFDPKGKIRYSVYAAFLILAAHEQRHLWQAARAVE
jgi:hypothetical protein